MRLARNISRHIGWEIPALGAFGLATWFQENLAILLPEFYNGLAVAKKVTLMMSELENLQQIRQQSHSQFEQLKKDIDNQDIVSENLQKNRQELESQESQIDLVVSEVGAWINIGKNRIFEELKKCWETDQDFQLDLIGLPESLIKLVNRKKLQLLPEYAQPLHNLPDWERVEKALNAESNRGFQNIRGREHRFDNFLQIILSKPPIVLSERDYQKWQKYAICFERYSQLNQTSRQGLVETFQQFFDENRSKYSLVWKPDNMSNTLVEVTDKIFNKILHHSREMLLPMKRRTQNKILKNKEHLEEISELQKSYKQEREVVEEEGKNLHQKLEQKYQEFINKLTGIEVQLEFNPEIHSLAKKYLESTPLEVLNDQSNFVAKVNSWENNLKQLEKIAPLLEPFTVLTDIKNLLQNKLNTVQEKADKSQEELQSSETEINQIKTALQQEPSITLTEERDWWKSAWKNNILF